VDFSGEVGFWMFLRSGGGLGLAGSCTFGGEPWPWSLLLGIASGRRSLIGAHLEDVPGSSGGVSSGLTLEVVLGRAPPVHGVQYVPKFQDHGAVPARLATSDEGNCACAAHALAFQGERAILPGGRGP
jgi:hypothetical protein